MKYKKVLYKSRIILWTLNISAIIIGLFLGIIWFNRLGLEYNSEGRYFDETISVVYEQDELLVYGILTLFFIIVGIVSWTITWRPKQTNRI